MPEDGLFPCREKSGQSVQGVDSGKMGRSSTVVFAHLAGYGQAGRIVEDENGVWTKAAVGKKEGWPVDAGAGQ